MTATFDPHPGLFWFYLLLGMGLLSMTGILWLSWLIRRDNLAGLLSMLLLWLAIDTLAKGVLRSTQAIVTHEQILYVSRVASFGIVTTAALIVDAYLSSRNGHLSGLRRLVLWYRKTRDPDMDIVARMEALHYDGHDSDDRNDRNGIQTLVAVQDGLDQPDGVLAWSDGVRAARRADWRA